MILSWQFVKKHDSKRYTFLWHIVVGLSHGKPAPPAGMNRIHRFPSFAWPFQSGSAKMVTESHRIHMYSLKKTKQMS